MATDSESAGRPAAHQGQRGRGGMAGWDGPGSASPSALDMGSDEEQEGREGGSDGLGHDEDDEGPHEDDGDDEAHRGEGGGGLN